MEFRALNPLTIRPYPEDNVCQRHGEAVEPGALIREHDHRTGRFRAWTCKACNTLIGYAEHAKYNPEAAEDTRLYLRGLRPVPSRLTYWGRLARRVPRIAMRWLNAPPMYRQQEHNKIVNRLYREHRKRSKAEMDRLWSKMSLEDSLLMWELRVWLMRSDKVSFDPKPPSEWGQIDLIRSLLTSEIERKVRNSKDIYRSPKSPKSTLETVGEFHTWANLARWVGLESEATRLMEAAREMAEYAWDDVDVTDCGFCGAGREVEWCASLKLWICRGCYRSSRYRMAYQRQLEADKRRWAMTG